jgi:predicted GIY-YIG superfamily endonuclease
MGKQSSPIKLLWPAKANGSWFLYGLELRAGRYYVGITRGPKNRIWQHCCGRRGAKWTGIYNPIYNKHLTCLYTRRESEAKKAENALTLRYMKQYGARRVRGGDYITTNPDPGMLARWEAEAAGQTPVVKVRKGKKVTGTIIL